MMTATKRARSDAQKDARRRAILEAAAELSVGEGYDAVTMAALARRAGLAKGTLYLYFASREEVLGGLYLRALRDWQGRVTTGIAPSASNAAIVAVLLAASRETPHFRALHAQFPAAVGSGLGPEALAGVRTGLAVLHTTIAGHLAICLGLPMKPARNLAQALLTAVQGAAADAGLLEDTSRFDANLENAATLLLQAVRPGG